MWTSAVCIAALMLAPEQGGDLELTNIRSTYGILGTNRPETKFLPGDQFFVAFDIENVRIDDNGKVLYSMAMEVVDGKEKVQFKQDPKDLTGDASLGGNRIAAFANVNIGLDQPPGAYTLRVTVTDRATKKTAKFERKFDVMERSFGVVRFTLSADVQGQLPAPHIAAAGQTLLVNFWVVGLERGGSKKQPDLSVEMQVYDDKDQPTLTKPFIGDIKELPKDLEMPKDMVIVPMDVPLALNRPGKFTVRIKATDRVSKKTAELSFPMMVLESK